MNRKGKIAFSGTAKNGSYVWAGDENGISVIAKSGDAIEGISNAQFASAVSTQKLLIASDGSVAFLSRLQAIPGGPVVNTPDQYALVVAKDGKLKSVMRGNLAAPGFTNLNMRFTELQAFTDRGLLFSAVVLGPIQAYSLWLWNDAGFSLVAINNEQFSEWADVEQSRITVAGNSCYIQGFPNIYPDAQMNDQGDVVFKALLGSATPSSPCPAQTRISLVEKSSGVFYSLLQENEPMPNMKVSTFTGNFNFALADDGKVGVADMSTSRWVVDATGNKLLMSASGEKFSDGNGALDGTDVSPPLADISGDYLVGSLTGFLYGSPRNNPYTTLNPSATSPLSVLWSWVNSLPGYTNPVLSNVNNWTYTRSGGLFFMATIVDGAGTAEKALWFRNPQGALTKMIATGETVVGSSSKIQDILMYSGSVMNGRPVSVSDKNTAVVQVLLNGGSHAVLVLTP